MARASPTPCGPRSPEDQITHQVQTVIPQALPDLPVQDKSIFNRVIAAMQLVVDAPHGTGTRISRDRQYSIAAKTGSAQVAGEPQGEEPTKDETKIPMKLRDNALFIAFAPAEDPRIVVALVQEHGMHGASASPIARKIMDMYLLGHVVYYEPRRGQSASSTAMPAPAEIRRRQ